MTTIEEVRARLEETTEGPWEFRWENAPEGSLAIVASKADAHFLSDRLREEDARFIANAPTDIAFLLAEVERLTSDLTGTDEVVDLLRERAEQAERERDALQVEHDAHNAAATQYEADLRVLREEHEELDGAHKTRTAQLFAMTKDRDQWKALAEARPEISPEMAATYASIWSPGLADVLPHVKQVYRDAIRDVGNALRAHAQKGGR